MKKTLLAAIAALTAMAAAAQTHYTVTGRAQIMTDKVYLLDIANRFARIDSAEVKDGEFKFEGTQATNAVLGVGSRQTAVLFFNDGTPLNVNLWTSTVKGSPLNEKLNAYDRQLDQMDRQMAELQMKAQSHPEQMEELKTAAMGILEKREELLKQIVSDNADNLIPAAFLGDMAYDMSFEELEKACAPTTAYYNHPAMAGPKALLKSLEKRAPGKQYTDMTLADMDGKEHKLSEWVGKGNYVMLDFWASWCGPCRQEMPNVVKNYAKYHAKGFEIVGISFDSKADAWKKAVAQLGLQWPQLSDLGGWRSSAVGVYGISSIPASILIDGNGKIVALNLRGEQLGEKLKEIYGF